MAKTRIVAACAAMLLAAQLGYADILNTSAKVRLNNSLIVDVQVTTSGGAGKADE